MFKKLRRRGQVSLEWAVLLVVVMGALLAMQAYFKRGIQGRWRSSVDGVGEQYDPMTTEANIMQRVSGLTTTTLSVQNLGNNLKQTIRVDESVMTETKQGTTRVDAY